MILIRLLYSNAHMLSKHSVEAAQNCQAIFATFAVHIIARVVWNVWRELYLNLERTCFIDQSNYFLYHHLQLMQGNY